MKRNLLVTGCLLVSSSVLFSGCATLFGGGDRQSLNIISDKPSTVNIYKVKHIDENATHDDSNKSKISPVMIHSNVLVPSTLNVDRDSDDILIQTPNGECKDRKVPRTLNGWFWGDVIATSLLSTTVDAVTGAMWKYDENVILECNK